MSGLNRLRWDIRTDTGGDYTSTSGPCAGGLIMQMRFRRNPAGGVDTGVLDTGCDFLLQAVDAAGTVLYNISHFTNAGGSSWTRVPRVLTYDTGGAALGDQYPVVTEADRLKLTVTQSAGVAGSKTGTFYVWTGW